MSKTLLFIFFSVGICFAARYNRDRSKFQTIYRRHETIRIPAFKNSVVSDSLHQDPKSRFINFNAKSNIKHLHFMESLTTKFPIKLQTILLIPDSIRTPAPEALYRHNSNPNSRILNFNLTHISRVRC